MKLTFLAAVALVLLQNVICQDGEAKSAEGYYGKSLGKLSEHHHGVKGHVYAVDARTLHIRHFSYDGEGPGGYFYAGNSKAPSGSGFRLRDEKGSPKVLRKYNDEHITLSLPEGKTLSSIKWFSVWCEDFSVNFGDVRIPKGFDAPKPQKLESLSGIHGVSSDPVVVVDSQTFLVPNFSYDGEAPDAKFWVGSGDKPSSQGIKVADENGRFEPLKKYERKTLVITLPGELTVHEIGHFGVWCEAFAVDFAHVKVPAKASVPPSLRMLGVAPQKAKTTAEIFAEYPELKVASQAAPASARRVSGLLLGAAPTTFRPPLSLYHPPAATVALAAPELQHPAGLQLLYVQPQPQYIQQQQYDQPQQQYDQQQQQYDQQQQQYDQPQQQYDQPQQQYVHQPQQQLYNQQYIQPQQQYLQQQQQQPYVQQAQQQQYVQQPQQQQYVQQPLFQFYPHPQQAYYLGHQQPAGPTEQPLPVHSSQQPHQYYYNY